MDSAEDPGSCYKILYDLWSFLSCDTLDFCPHYNFSGIKCSIHPALIFNPRKNVAQMIENQVMSCDEILHR